MKNEVTKILSKERYYRITINYFTRGKYIVETKVIRPKKKMLLTEVDALVKKETAKAGFEYCFSVTETGKPE